ncbi:MAG: HEXXH motif-containing putative peptide modification protein [Candidatus Gracilibacteria bacterium]|nr:HEXXH motif-containing putative peptide modification protein [Candidatus Gracilibacteria bacterium]
MQDLKYYVLGVKDSPLLKKYFDKYYNKLISDLKEISEKGILSQEINKLLQIENRQFLLNPDQSSVINLLYKEFVENKSQKLLDKSIYVELFKKEIDFFLAGKEEELIMNQGTKIYGTNIKLTNIDNNPFKTQEAHPEHIQNGAIIGYGERSEKEWLEVYTKTFELLKKIDEGIYDELNQIIDKIVPLGTARSMHNSASYKECIGHLYMGYTIDSKNPEINNLEAIIHESSHNKLNLIMQFDEIVLNDKKEIYYSAIRPDARPIIGVFLGYHAFAPTMYVIMKSYLEGALGDDKSWLDKIVLYYMKTKFLQRTIKKYAVLTELGKEISEEIDFVISKMDELIRKLNPSKEILLKAKEAQNKHFNEVNQNYKYLIY